MRSKTLIAACLAALILTLGVFHVARTVLIRSFAEMEADSARQGIERVRRALEAELRQLDVSAINYARWDDTYDHVLGRFPDFFSAHLSRSVLEILRVDLIWIVDEEGNTVGAIGQDDAAEDGVAPLPATLVRALEKDAAWLTSESASKTPSLRFLRLANRPLAFATAPILRSNLTGPSVGTLLFARFLDRQDAERLTQTSQLPVEITSLVSARSVGQLDQGVLEWLATSPAPHTQFVQAQDDSQLNGHVVLPDVTGHPLFLLSATVPRDALQLGKRTINAVVIALLAGFAAVVLLLLAILNRSWRSREATQRQRLDQQRKLSRLARRDSLTGLPNRLHLQRLLPRLLARASRDRWGIALLYIDLDHFKNINDSLGHNTGDRLLEMLAMRLRQSVARHDLVVRMGGDEFVVVATGLPDQAGIEAIARRIHKEMSVPVDIDGMALTVAPSIGISVFPQDGTTPEQLLKHADIALYQAKDRGRGNHQFFTAEMNARLTERLGMERSLRRALDAGELLLEYQPSFDLTTLRPVSMEALVRWRSAQHGLVPPARFIPIAEQSGLIVEIGEWVLRRVCLQLAEWQSARVPLLPVSVNISARQFEHTRLADTVGALTRELGIDANLLHFEITEGVAMQSSQAQFGALQALRNLGSRILIDDFGTGYSSLSYLKHLPIDTLKIDRAFVRDMAIDVNDLAIVSAIVGIADSLGLHVVAEGIETEEQLDCLRRLGCEVGQGFYFSPPVSADACRQLLEKVREQRLSSETMRRLRALTLSR